MQWEDRSNANQRHWFLSPSKHSWLTCDDDKLISNYEGEMRKIRGTELHAWAAWTIELGLTQSKSKQTLYMYVNDAIKYNMSVEQTLIYDPKYAGGTADAITLDGNLLRIHDLKTGETPASMDQLLCYAALFCLSRNWDPYQLMYELRIYQSDQIVIYKPTPDEVAEKMDRYIHCCQVLHQHFDNEQWALEA